MTTFSGIVKVGGTEVRTDNSLFFASTVETLTGWYGTVKVEVEFAVVGLVFSAFGPASNLSDALEVVREARGRADAAIKGAAA